MIKRNPFGKLDTDNDVKADTKGGKAPSKAPKGFPPKGGKK